jgi:hypothetical protein
MECAFQTICDGCRVVLSPPSDLRPPGPRDKVLQLNREFVVLVSASDYERLCAYSWTVQVNSLNVYAARWQKSGGKREKIFMHRAITDAPPRIVVDHFNHWGLDNRRPNLVVTGYAQNNHNRGHVDSLSGFRGVVREHRKWRARIQHNHVERNLGLFNTAREAACAYDAAARSLYGEFAYQNFPALEVEDDPISEDIPF